MKNFPKTFTRVLSTALAVLVCGGAITPMLPVAADDRKEIIVNDSETGTGNFQFDFHGQWVHEGGFPDRFVGGDEHWTTTNQFGSNYPGVTFRFVGERVAIYGHKVPEGGMASVSVDGEAVGTVDFYNPSRIEKVLLFESDKLTESEHTVTLQLVADKNPSAGNTHEASIDYAVVTTSSGIPATGVRVDTEKITLEAGMSYPVSYTILPEYATESPDITYSSSDESVASVDEAGVITAKGVGEAVITLAPADKSFSGTMTVKVREHVGGDLICIEGDTNVHTKPEDYYDLFERLNGKESTKLGVTAWLGDVVSAKIDMFTTGKALQNVKFTAGELVNDHGDKLDGEVSLYFIKTVLAHDTGKYVPDVLYSEGPVDLPASSVSSVWVQIKTAKDALPGDYTGEITVTADGLDTPEILTLTVEVIGLERPEGDVPFEVWQYPYSSNRYYSGKTTAEYFGDGLDGLWNTHLDPTYEAGLRSQLELYKAAGGNSVTVTIVEDAWGSQTPDPYPSMIKWTQKKDGTFVFDYTDFDYYVELCASCGIDGPIMAFSIGDWVSRITYYSEQRDKVVYENLNPGSLRYTKIWMAFLTDLMAHTKEKGWFDRVHMAMDERGPEVVEAVLDVVESVKDENGQHFKTALAVYSFETEYLFDRITDLSLAITLDAGHVDKITAHRKSMGLTTTIYTCGPQNSALSNAPIESLYTLWYAAQRGADGFLRWALDAFNVDPLNSSYHRVYVAGDIYLIYPDLADAKEPTAHSSARFEKLAEGVRDVAKLGWVLENYPEYEKSLGNALKSIGGDMAKTVANAQKRLNSAGREIALAELIKAAEASEYANDKNLTAAVSAAQEVLEGRASAKEQTEAAYGIAKILKTLNASPDKYDPIDVPDNIDNDTDEKKDFPTTAVIIGAAVAIIAAAAITVIVVLKKKKKDN